MKKISLSANIETGFANGEQYIATPNAKQVAARIVNGFNSGIHSYTIIGTYGTGKSSFLIALGEDLKNQAKAKRLIPNIETLANAEKFNILDIVGDYESLALLLAKRLNVERNSESVIDALRGYYERLKGKGEFLVIMIDEFGKVLEHAAKNAPESELYFLQKLAEFVNVPTRNIILLTTLHQNFSSYAKGLNQEQKNEWTKVKGRFQEIVFVEPVEQILYLAAKQNTDRQRIADEKAFEKLYSLSKETKFISDGLSLDMAESLYPLDPFSAYCITQAIQRYGQNERSLFTFLNAYGNNTISSFHPQRRLTYNLQEVYDYVVYNFYSYLKDANADAMNWSAMRMAIERVENRDWTDKAKMINASKVVKSIGIMNLFGNAGFMLSREQLATYAEYALGIEDGQIIIEDLERLKIIRYAEYKHRLILFEGTDVNIEEEISKAGMVVSRPIAYVAELREFFEKKVTPAKATYYHRGTPRFFEYMILDNGIDIIPTGDVDGYIELIFSSHDATKKQIMQMSADCEHAIIFAYFNNTDKIVDHLYNIDKYDYILRRVLIDKSDRVAVNEINNLLDHETVLLSKSLHDSLFNFSNNVTWIYKGQTLPIHSQRDFNKLLSDVCDEVYDLAPVMKNELFNKNKLSSSISSARAKYLNALLENSDKTDLGFDANKFPPEKTIFFSLLKSTGLYVNNEFADRPSNGDIATLWDACEDFLKSTVNRPRKVSELIKNLSAQPYKLKMGFLDFWIPTYLYIKRQDYSLHGDNGSYIPEINMEVFELMQKHPNAYLVKAFDVSGVKMEFFNQYRKFINLDSVGGIKSDRLIETIRPFFFFYNHRLNDYAKHTNKFDHETTKKFRDTLAKAKDPEKAFLEDIPTALGYDKDAKNSEQFAKEYAYIINRAVKELRGCYSKLIDRIENRIVEVFGLPSADYNEYIIEVRQRLSAVKTFLLTDRLREFYNHAMAEYDNRTEWYQAICYTALGQPLDRLRDYQEEKLIDELIELFHECEKYAEISKVKTNSDDEIYAFDLVSTDGSIIKPQTYRLPHKDRDKSQALEKELNAILGDNNNDLAVVTLLRVLKERMKK